MPYHGSQDNHGPVAELSPTQVVTQRGQDLVLELVLQDKGEVIALELPRRSIFGELMGVQRIGGGIADIAGLRAGDHAGRARAVNTGCGERRTGGYVRLRVSHD